MLIRSYLLPGSLDSHKYTAWARACYALEADGGYSHISAVRSLNHCRRKTQKAVPFVGVSLKRILSPS